MARADVEIAGGFWRAAENAACRQSLDGLAKALKPIDTPVPAFLQDKWKTRRD